MLGGAIGGRSLGEGGKRVLSSEQAGPRPAGVRDEATNGTVRETRTARATKP